MGDNKAPGGPTSLTSSVSSGVSSNFHGYEDPPGLHEKVTVLLLYSCASDELKPVRTMMMKLILFRMIL